MSAVHEDRPSIGARVRELATERVFFSTVA